MNIKNLTLKEMTLLLLLETHAVNNWGRIQAKFIDQTDLQTAEQWNRERFILFGRIAKNKFVEGDFYYCKLSFNAWKAASRYRRLIAQSNWKYRSFKTTEEEQKNPRIHQ